MKISRFIEYIKDKFGTDKKMIEYPAIKDTIYGGLVELMNNTKYYRKSSVDPRYSHWTEEGKVVLMEYMNNVSQSIHEAENDKLLKAAKQLVIDGLKGEK